jgi:polysaccharide pyruvyl transferase WcaK-like protein
MRRVTGRPPRVLFDGWYGYRNTGDDAFCLVASHVAATEWGVREPWFVGRGGYLPQLPVQIRDVVPHRARFRGQVRTAVAVAAARARRVVHAGGSRFKSVQKIFKDQVVLHRMGIIDLHLASVSIGPFSSPGEAKYLASLLKHVASISVRDKASQERLLDVDPLLPVTVGFDLAVLLPDIAQSELIRGPRTASTEKVIGLSLCPAESRHGGDREVERERLNRVIDLVRQVVRRTSATVRMLEFCGHPTYGDRPSLNYAIDALREETLVQYVSYMPNPIQMMSAVSATDFVIAMRLHAGIFAFAVGVPCLNVPYERKGRDVGLMYSREEFIAPMRGPNIEQGTLVERALESNGEATFHLSAEVARERARAALPHLGVA